MSDRPNIMIVNDDGIYADGLRALVDAMKDVANVYVCAPDSERSGASQSITIVEKIYITEVDYPGAKAALTTTGTPADCTKVGIQFFGDKGVELDVIYSGINMGSNLGRDTLYSGTVGAAMEGALSDIRSVAVSVNSHTATIFGPACKAALMVLDYVMEQMTPGTVLNVNVPHIPEEEIKGVRTAKLAGRYYEDVFLEQMEGGYRMDGRPRVAKDAGMELDSTCLLDGWITITPLLFDYTDHQVLKEVTDNMLATWEEDFLEGRADG